MSNNRWSKISKKFTDNPDITSDEVKTFLEMNFTNGYHEKLCGSSTSSTRIDPGLIMDMRHESVCKLTKVNNFHVKIYAHYFLKIKSRKAINSSSKFKAQKELNMESIRNHNNLVESRMIVNELSKFKMDIRKLSAKSSIATSHRYVDSLDSCDEDSEEMKLLEALRNSEDATFAFKNDSNNIVIEKKRKHVEMKPKIEFHELSYEEGSGLSGFSGSSTTISEESQEKAVHFKEDYIKVSTQPKSANLQEFQEYYEISEDHNKFSTDDDLEKTSEIHDDDCFLCFNDAERQFSSRSFDLQPFYSLPNLNDGDIEGLMKITKFQSMMTVERTSLKDYACTSTPDLSSTNEDNKIQQLNRSIEEAETERMLIVRRMEIEEKNYQQLVIMNNSTDPPPIESEKIISNLFLESQESVEEKRLLRASFKDWLQKTTVAKILKTNAFNNEDRVKKINIFLNKIRLEHNKNLSHKAKTESKASIAKQTSTTKNGKALKKDYEHKMKIQQDVIELQKLKIQRQERLITEMKLAKFSEMLKDSKNDLKKELINAKRGNTKIRAKARCIQVAANIPPDPEEEERRQLLAQGLIVPKFLQQMQERASVRLARHDEARERRLKLEQEKEEQKLAAEMAKKLEDEEAKRKRLLEMREKRRQEKLAKQIKEQERQRFMENMKKAKELYARNLLKNIGFKGFQLLIRLKRTNHKKSTIHRRKMCMNKSFTLWHMNTKIIWDGKRAQADRLHELSVMRFCFKVWKHIHSINKKKSLVAIDWYEVKITEKLFKCWIQFTSQSKFFENAKMRKAEAHYNW
ncbi:CLUMA_CG011772, isoform A [Clunio marinus]|uniref:CLUMA_CG011772, isoform A n=1 Tax=Clunio marinus TaxID=568069 RepID=A0A1J1IH99_9DIPT|nr:CLUMA_CG011772, isoform A [Clunio marinus]